MLLDVNNGTKFLFWSFSSSYPSGTYGSAKIIHKKKKSWKCKIMLILKCKDFAFLLVQGVCVFTTSVFSLCFFC